MPVLGLPLLLLGLVGLPMVAGIYWLRTRFRRQEVSTLFLWRSALEAQGGGRKKSRLQTPLALLLELLAILLLVLAATSPRVLRAGHTASVIVVLDDSYSMTAVDAEGVSSRQRAVESLERELNGLRRYAVRLIAAGTQPRVLGQPMDRWTEVEAALDGWRCDAATADLTGAIALAGEVGDPRSRLLVLSDHAMPEAMRAASEDAEAVEGESAEDAAARAWGRLRWVSVGQTLPNVAITHAVRSPDAAQGDRVMLEITNHSPAPARPTLTLSAGTSDTAYRNDAEAQALGTPTVLERNTIVLAAGASTRLWLSPAVAEGRPLVAELNDDALGQDNRVVLMPAERRLLPVSVELENADLDRAVTQAVRASNRARLVGEGALLRFTDAATPTTTADAVGSPPTPRWTVRFDTGSAETSGEPQAFLGPFVIDFAHPVSDGLSLNGLVWAVPGSASQEQAPPPGRPVVTAGNVVLLSDDARPDGTHRLTWRLRPDRSTLLQSAAMPILVWNMIEMRQAARPGLSPANARPGVPVSIVTGAGRGAVDVQRVATRPEDIASTESLPIEGGAALFIPDRPGLFEVVAGERRHRLAVNAPSSDESDLSAAGAEAFGQWDDDLAVVREYRNLSYVLGLLALALLVFHAWWFARQRGGGVGAKPSDSSVPGVGVPA